MFGRPDIGSDPGRLDEEGAEPFQKPRPEAGDPLRIGQRRFALHGVRVGEDHRHEGVEGAPDQLGIEHGVDAAPEVAEVEREPTIRLETLGMAAQGAALDQVRG